MPHAYGVVYLGMNKQRSTYTASNGSIWYIWFDPKPVPTSYKCDWSFQDSDDEALCGTAATRAEAIERVEELVDNICDDE